MKSVYCAVRTGFLNKAVYASSLEGYNTEVLQDVFLQWRLCYVNRIVEDERNGWKFQSNEPLVRRTWLLATGCAIFWSPVSPKSAWQDRTVRSPTTPPHTKSKLTLSLNICYSHLSYIPTIFICSWLILLPFNDAVSRCYLAAEARGSTPLVTKPTTTSIFHKDHFTDRIMAVPDNRRCRGWKDPQSDSSLTKALHWPSPTGAQLFTCPRSITSRKTRIFTSMVVTALTF